MRMSIAGRSGNNLVVASYRLTNRSQLRDSLSKLPIRSQLLDNSVISSHSFCHILCGADDLHAPPLQRLPGRGVHAKSPHF